MAQITVSRPIPQQPRRHSPWVGRLLLALALTVATALVTSVVITVVNPLPSPAPTQQTEVNAPAVPVVVPAGQNLPAQTEPEVSALVMPVVVDYQVTWTEVQGFDPSTIPVEEGFYNGETNEVSWNPNDLNSVPAGDAFAWKIFPQFTTRIRGSPVAVARAPDNKNVVLASLSINGNPPPRILLSIDGEKSWYTLNLLPVDSNGDDAVAVRVVTYGEKIHLYGQDPRPGYHWWEAIVTKNELP